MEKTKSLIKYAQFLLKEDLVKDLANTNLNLIARDHPSLLQAFSSLSNVEIQYLFQQTEEKFLKDIAENTILANILESFIKWNEFQPMDIVLAYSVRKKTLMKFVYLFTIDPTKVIQIEEELNALLLILEKTGLNFCEEQNNQR